MRPHSKGKRRRRRPYKPAPSRIELEDRRSNRRLTVISLLVLLLAAIGLFGLASYSVAQRTNEIGIRMALGAQRVDVVRMILRESLLLVIVGIGLGAAATLAAGRLVSSLLFGIAPTDALTLVVAVTAMVLVSTIAGYFPARRASRIDPMVAMQYE